MKLPTCTGHVSVHLFLSYALVRESQSCQPHSKGGNLALAAPDLGATASALFTSVCLMLGLL